MSQANIPNITPAITITREDAITILLSSIALEGLAMSQIINAEGEKLQFILGTLPQLQATNTNETDKSEATAQSGQQKGSL
jgi:hypothetical protein